MLKSLMFKTCNFIIRETPTQVFSCEYWEIFESTYFVERQRTATM